MNPIETYLNLLSRHDWWYSRSDDHSVYRQGAESARQIQQLRREVDPNWSIWNSTAPPDFHITPQT